MAITECRTSCHRARIDAGIEFSPSAIDTFLESLSESTFTRLASSHGVSFPLSFPTLTTEINFLSVLSLLNAFSGYRALFHAQTGEGAYQNVVRLLIGLYLTDDGDALGTKGLIGLNANTVAGIWNVRLVREIPHESIPGLSIMEKGGEMSEVVDLVVGACRETGEVLKGLGFGSLGEWVEGLLRRMVPIVEAGEDLAAADMFVQELSNTFPAFRDISSPSTTYPHPIQIHKRTFFLLLSLHQRLSSRRGSAASTSISRNGTEPDAPANETTPMGSGTGVPRIPDPRVLPMFVDNVLPTMSVYHGLLDLGKCNVSALRAWGETMSRARTSGSAVFSHSPSPPPLPSTATANANANGSQPTKQETIEPGPEFNQDEAYVIRAATLDLGREIVRRAHELGRDRGRMGMEWMVEMSEVDLDGYLWSVAKDDPVLRKVPRMVEKRTIMY